MKVEKSVAELAATILSGRSDLTEEECVRAAQNILRASAGTSMMPVPIAAESSTPRKRSASEVVAEITRQKNSARKWEAFRRFSTAHQYKFDMSHRESCSGGDNPGCETPPALESPLASGVIQAAGNNPATSREQSRKDEIIRKNRTVLWKGLDGRESEVASELLKCHSPRPKSGSKSARRPSTLMISDGDVERLKKLFAAYAKLTERKNEISVAKKVAKKLTRAETCHLKTATSRREKGR